MRFIIFLCLLGFISCKNEDKNLVVPQNNKTYQIRLQFIEQNGDSSYSEIKVLK